MGLNHSVQKRVVYIFLILGFIVILHRVWEGLVTHTLVKFIFSEVKPELLSDVLVIVAGAGIIVYLLSRWRFYIVSGWATFILFFSTIAYSYYRIGERVWIFTRFYIDKNLAYADIIYLLVVVQALLWFSNRLKKKPVSGLQGFCNDEPIGDSTADELNYQTYVSIIVDRIYGSYFNKAFAIGINGKWGTGKTSFLDLLKRQLKEKSDMIYADFDPWRCQTPESVIKEFFSTVMEALRPYHSDLPSLLIRYAEHLLKENSNGKIKTAAVSLSTVTGYDSLETLYKEINQAVRAIGKQLVVFIDDVDRLDKEEIVEVIRLIRNTANFSHTFFIVAYDRSYVLKALSGHNAYNHEQFLEKIFQLEISLPHFDRKILQERLAVQLCKITPEIHHELIRQQVVGTATLVPTYLIEWLESLRDVSRLANSLALNMSGLWGEVVLSEVIQLELLRIKYPGVYTVLHKMRNEFLETSNQLNGRYELQLKTDPDKKVTLFYNHMKENAQRYSVPTYELDKVYGLVTDLFGGSRLTAPLRSALTVRNPDKFSLYFRYRLDADTLSETEFLDAMDSPALHEKIKKWVENGLESELQSRLMRIKRFESRATFEKYISAIFFLAGQRSRHRHRTAVGYDAKDLFSKLHDGEKRITKKIYKSAPNDAYAAFLKSLFTTAKLPFYYESEFISYLLEKIVDLTDIFPMTKEELIRINVGYLKAYGEVVTTLDWAFWGLFHDCKYSEWTATGPSTMKSVKRTPKMALDVFRNFVEEKFLDQFLIDVLCDEPFTDNIYTLSELVDDMFGNTDSFIAFLEKQKKLKKWEYVPEFLKFLKTIDFTVNRTGKFEFKVIPVRKGTVTSSSDL